MKAHRMCAVTLLLFAAPALPLHAQSASADCFLQLQVVETESPDGKPIHRIIDAQAVYGAYEGLVPAFIDPNSDQEKDVVMVLRAATRKFDRYPITSRRTAIVEPSAAPDMPLESEIGSSTVKLTGELRFSIPIPADSLILQIKLMQGDTVRQTLLQNTRWLCKQRPCAPLAATPLTPTERCCDGLAPDFLEDGTIVCKKE